MKCRVRGCGGKLSGEYIGVSLQVPEGYDLLLVGFRRCRRCSRMHSSKGRPLLINNRPIEMTQAELESVLATPEMLEKCARIEAQCQLSEEAGLTTLRIVNNFLQLVKFWILHTVNNPDFLAEEHLRRVNLANHIMADAGKSEMLICYVLSPEATDLFESYRDWVVRNIRP